MISRASSVVPSSAYVGTKTVISIVYSNHGRTCHPLASSARVRLNGHRLDAARLLFAYGLEEWESTMPARSELTITKRTVDALRVESGDAVFWDRTLPGFGIRIYASGRKLYVVQVRGPAGSKRVALGTHGDLAADEARKNAAAVIDRIKRGEEPHPPPPAPEPTVADLAERYLRVHVATHCNAGTAGRYRAHLKNHILPALGTKRVRDVGRAEVAALHHDLRAKRRTANQTVKILSKMFSLAEGWKMVPPGHNPCRSVRRYKEESRERFLSPDEWRSLGRALREAEADGSMWPQAIAALRLLMLTGCRRQEIVTLRWDDVDRTARELRLRRRQDRTADGAADASPLSGRWTASLVWRAIRG